MMSSGLLQSVIGQCSAPSWPLGGHGTKGLVPHRKDRAMKCILDPSEVLKTIKFQGEEMMKLQRKDSDNSIVESIELKESRDRESPVPDSKWEVESSIFGGLAKTDVTTATGATRPVINSDHIAAMSAKNKFRRKGDACNVIEAIGQQHSLARPNKSTKQAGSGQRGKKPNKRTPLNQTPPRPPTPVQKVAPPSTQTTVDETSTIAGGLQQLFMMGTKEEPGTKSKAVLPPGVQLTGVGCSALADPFVHSKPGSRTDEYSVALHLKMKAKCSKYYWSTYRRTFPDSPLPQTMDFELSRNSSFQTLSQTSSDNSLTAPQVGYGEHVHSSPIRLMVNDTDFMDLGMTGSLGLVHRIEVDANGQLLKSPRYYKVLLNRRSGVPIAVCALKSPEGSPIVRIYATKPRVVGQKPAASTKSLGLNWCTRSFPLYAWAEFTAEGEFPNPVRYSLFMSKGSEGRFEADPSYRASHKTAGSPEIVVVGKTETERDYNGCAVVSLEPNPHDLHFALCVARGIDPALIICLTGIVDEVMENSMRITCDASGKKKRKPARPTFS